MSVFVIFWAAAMCIVFFLLGVICKGCAALFRGLLNSLGKTTVISILLGLCLVGLFLIYAVANEIAINGFGSAVGGLIGLIAAGAISIGIIVWFGEIIIGFFIIIGEAMITVVSTILEKASNYCERIYIHFLQIIIKRIEK